MLRGQSRVATTALFLCLLAAALPRTVTAQGAEAPPPLTVGEYLAELDALQVRIEGLTDLEGARALRDSLRPLKVRYGEHTTEVSFAWLDETMKGMQRPGQVEWLKPRAARRLAAMRAEAERLLPREEGEEAPAPPAGARARLESILKQPEFGAVREPNWLDRLRQRIALAIIEFLDRLLRVLGASPVTGNILVWVLIALLLIIAALWVRRILARQATAKGLELPFSRPARKTWQTWAREASEAARRGDYRLAVHNLYWAFIFRLEEMGVWKLDRARTHREYLRLLPPRHQHRAPLDGVTRCFEAVWYANQAATPEDFREVSAQMEKIGCPLGSIPQTEKSSSARP